jgi:hypothetical protein
LIYRLKQAGWTWYQKLDACLDEIGLTQTTTDNCVYQRFDSQKVLLITVYVNDLIILSNDGRMMTELKEKLSEHFDMKDLGEIKYCLGFQVICDQAQGTI